MFSRWINFSLFPCWTRGLIYSRQYSKRLFAARSLRIFFTLGQFSSCLSEVALFVALSYCSCHRFKPCLFFLKKEGTDYILIMRGKVQKWQNWWVYAWIRNKFIVLNIFFLLILFHHAASNHKLDGNWKISANAIHFLNFAGMLPALFVVVVF